MKEEARREFSAMAGELKKARLGCHLVIPLRYEKNGLKRQEIETLGRYMDVETADLTQSVQELFRRTAPAPVGACYAISRADLLKQFFSGEQPVGFSVLDERDPAAAGVPFDFHTAWLYVFHTQVAFLCLAVTCGDMEAIYRMRSPGFAERWAACRWMDGAGEEHPFSLDEKLKALFARLGVEQFFPGRDSPLMEAFTDTVAVVPRRFLHLDTIRKVVFNLHLMIPPDSPAEDDSEEDVRFVYAVKTQSLGSYRWGCCVSSQTISYVSARAELDLDGEMAEHARDSLPLILVALYEKYTCLRFTQLIAGADKRDMKQLRALKRLMLEFRAYGTVDSANISRWHNIKQIYQAILETNRIPEAVEDITHKLNILVEHQREIQSARNDTVAWVLTLFGIVSILASVLSIIQILSGGDPLAWLATILSTLVMAALVAVVLLMRRRED